MRLHQARSLKDKRREVKSLVDRLRRKFNVSVAEVGNPEMYREVVLGVSCVANQHRQVRLVLDTVAQWVEGHCAGDLLASEFELF